jgi:DNA-binding CsgD family transcriptional regulator
MTRHHREQPGSPIHGVIFIVVALIGCGGPGSLPGAAGSAGSDAGGATGVLVERVSHHDRSAGGEGGHGNSHRTRDRSGPLQDPECGWENGCGLRRRRGPFPRARAGYPGPGSPMVVAVAPPAILEARGRVIRYRKGTRGLRRAPTATDVMRILDAAYDVGQPRERWMSGVTRAAGQTLDWGAGIGGLLYDISDQGQVHVDFMEGLDVPQGWLEAGLAVHGDSRFVPKIVASYRSTLCATLPQLVEDPNLFGTLRSDYYDRHAVGGQVMINGIDCSGKGCVLYLFSRRPVSISGGQRDLFTRLATHLSTAYRLQRRVADGAQTGSIGAEAVLTPKGRLEHAEPGARSAEARQDLTLAVRQRERARRSAEWDAERVARSLKGMVSARWTLIDHYESGGKRYVLARENAPNPSGPAKLSLREKQVVSLAALGRSNKLIAYELGLAFSTVRVLMARACAKVGASTRSELIAQQRSSLVC